MRPFVTHGRIGNFSRPRELLEGRSVERLRAAAEGLGLTDIPDKTTKAQLIEMITTDSPRAVEAPVEEAPVAEEAAE